MVGSSRNTSSSIRSSRLSTGVAASASALPVRTAGSRLPRTARRRIYLVVGFVVEPARRERVAPVDRLDPVALRVTPGRDAAVLDERRVLRLG
jgi:hypothetical protein